MQIIRSIAPTFTRPNDTTAYTAGDLIANSTSAGSVTNREFVFDRWVGQELRIMRWYLEKTDGDIANADFLLALFTVAPTYTSAGDNSATGTVLVTTSFSHIGTMRIAAMVGSSTFGHGMGGPLHDQASYVPWRPDWSSDGRATLYGVMVANAAYTPAANGTFKCVLEGEVC
jgi:hypothetical protein